MESEDLNYLQKLPILTNALMNNICLKDSDLNHILMMHETITEQDENNLNKSANISVEYEESPKSQRSGTSGVRSQNGQG